MQMNTGSSSDHDQHSPSFFKVVRDPSSPHLSLPNAFVKRYLEKIPKNPTLKTVTGEHSWRLKFIKIGESYCFGHGWEKLVKDAQLCARDILVCWLIDDFTFLVSFLGANGCEKCIPFNTSNDDDIVVDGHLHDNGEIVGDDVVGNLPDNGDIVGNDDIVGDGECHADEEVMPEQNVSFQKAIPGKSHRYRLALPRRFVEDAGLEHKRSIQLKDHEGKEWTMEIRVEHYGRTRHCLARGWFVFQKYHRLLEGDVCIFTFNKKEGVLKLAQLYKSKTPIEQETPMESPNRNRGRPPIQNVKVEDMWSPKEKPCGGVKVKTEYESGPEGEVEKRKRGRPPLKKPGGGSNDGGVKVKTEYESDPEGEIEKRKRGSLPLKKPGGGGDAGGVKVKIEDASLPEMEEPKRKRGRPQHSGGVVKRTEPEAERWIGSKHVIYF